MSLAKLGQLGLDGIRVRPEDLSLYQELQELDEEFGDPEDSSDVRVDLEVSPESDDEESALAEGGELSGDLVLEIDEDNVIEKSFSFDLPAVPGADDQTEIEEPELEVQEAVDTVQVESDPWKWNLSNAMQWAKDKLSNIPRHSGRDILGLERTIAYLKRVMKEFSKMTQMDYDDVLDISALEHMRNETMNGIKRLEERRDKIENSKKTKKADFQADLVKNAGNSQFTVNVPLFISGLARVVINSWVSAGHDMDRSIIKLSKKFDLTKRELFELTQLLMDMNYPVRRDRGFSFDEEIDTTSSDNFDWAANYPA